MVLQKNNLQIYNFIKSTDNNLMGNDNHQLTTEIIPNTIKYNIGQILIQTGCTLIQ